MSVVPNISSFNQVASGSVAPRSAGAINANRANRYAMADAGARHNQKYVTALSSGGLSAPQQKR